MYQTERLILRNWTATDIQPFIGLNRDLKVMEFYPHVFSEAESIAAINSYKEHFRRFGYTLFVCETKTNKTFVGTVGLINHQALNAPHPNRVRPPSRAGLPTPPYVRCRIRRF